LFMLTSFTTALRTKKVVTLTAIVALAGCAAPTEENTDDEVVASSESSIVGGTTTSSYAAVGAFVEAGEPFCTGTVIAPRVVLTAAHCFEGARAATVRFVLGPNAFAPSASLRVARLVAHPSYNPFELTNDIGVAVLSQDAPVAPIPVNTAALDASWVGRSLTFVGYGVTNGVTGAGGGVKRQVTIPIAQVGATQFAYTGSKGTCFGDSGGPAFLQSANGSLSVVGVTSYGDQRCRQFGVDTRVDVYRSFLASASQ